MQRNDLLAVVFSTVIVVVGFGGESKSGVADETEILNITVGKPTKLSSETYQNSSVLLASRTGAVGVIYAKPGREPRYPENTRRGMAMGYRVSIDGGETWGEEMIAPDEFGGGQCSGMLRDGGAIIAAKNPQPSTDFTRAKGWEGYADPSENPEGLQKDWFDILYLRFTDDMLTWQSETVRIYQPKGVPFFRGEGGLGFAKGKMVQLPNGDLLSPMGGAWEGDGVARSWIVRSTDQGRTFKYYATIDYSPQDLNPELPGHYIGSDEPSIAMLPNGQMVAMLRKQYAHYAGEYKPMAVCWSDDVGKTWTKPITTKPHLMNISPTLAALDNGVVACQYGRPGFHVAFSLDHGHTWQDRVSFSHLPEPVITGQFDMIKTGPNRIVAVGSDSEGTKAWPVTVERVTVSPAHATLAGRIVDEKGSPVAGARVERSPNRYAADDWTEDEAGKKPEGTPHLAFRSIQPDLGHPTVRTDTDGRFTFDSAHLGEYILTVEAEGYAPQQRHVKVEPQSKPQDFALKPGQLVGGQIVDVNGKPIGGICVVLNRWHCHTDNRGIFHWAAEAPVPQSVAVKIYKQYHAYQAIRKTMPLSEIDGAVFTLREQ